MFMMSHVMMKVLYYSHIRTLKECRGMSIAFLSSSFSLKVKGQNKRIKIMMCFPIAAAAASLSPQIVISTANAVAVAVEALECGADAAPLLDEWPRN